ncbi:cupredoxin domain-containing protein [Natronobiforma cellulositropha]|uniref:cupredoxin domain-containing protein n=1 Tax=Natronobiforma cellulositropha TaxID=1679076 RepID=UPI0021D5FED4|nr:plastocyanin/azurin family copper-binding protein [Natronobiforma cellulositropha]
MVDVHATPGDDGPTDGDEDTRVSDGVETPARGRSGEPGPADGAPDRQLERRALLLAVGAGGAALLSRAVAAQDEETEPPDDEPADEAEAEDEEADEADEATDEEGADEPAAGETETVAVVDYAYEPGTDSPHVIAPGTTVEWIWETDNHNIVVDAQPDEADWPGHEPIENTGFEYEYTFEVEGDYEYHCTPHIGLGMVASITVTDDPDAAAGEGPIDLVPPSAMLLVVATTVSLVAVLGLSYVFMKYGGPPAE